MAVEKVHLVVLRKNIYRADPDHCTTEILGAFADKRDAEKAADKERFYYKNHEGMSVVVRSLALN